MLGKCFSLLCIISFIFAILTGNMPELCASIIDGASKSVTLTISLVGIMVLWSGIIELLKKSGIINIVSRLLKPILRLVFPHAFKSKEATEEITACVSANILGISNATTPLAIKAIEKMQESRRSDIASNDMIMLSVLGCSSFCLIPTTVLALRQSVGAQITYEIIPLVWIASGTCMILGIIICRLLGKLYAED